MRCLSEHSTLELSFVISFGPGGRSSNPIRGGVPIEFESEKIFSKKPSEQSDWGNDQEKEDRQQHVGDNESKNDGQGHPGDINVFERPRQDRAEHQQDTARDEEPG